MAHLIQDDRNKFDKTPAEWLKVGSQINELVNQWAERDDIVTFVGEGAGMGAPACFVPALAEMQVNVELAFDKAPHPSFIGDLRKRTVQFDHPVAMGATMHEAFHAKHTTLNLLLEIKDAKVSKFEKNLATWFEETRIEGKGVRALPKNRAFLRACALRLVIGDLKESEDFAGQGIEAFSQLILLTLARVDAGVLDFADVKIIHDAALDLFGEDVYEKLQDIWLRAQAHDDDGTAAPLLALAAEWVEVLKDSGNEPGPDGDGIPDWLKELLQQMMGEGSGSEGEDGEDGDGEGSPGGGGLLDQMADDAETDAQSEANEQAVQEVMEMAAEARKAAAAESKDHKDEATKMFSKGTGPGPAYTSSRLYEQRNPTADERKAAVALGKALERAQYRDRVSVKRSSVVPPGRLNARRALAAAEQKSRGAEVTAEAWSRKQRKHTDDPTLTVGVLVDISGSMGSAMEPMASTAWIMSEATRRVAGKCAMVYYGNDAFPTLAPGQHFDKVNVYSAPDGTEKFDKGFRALNGALNMLDSTGARLLVIVSDLFYGGWEMDRTRYWMQRCRDAGVAVIVVPFDEYNHAKGVVKGIQGVEVIKEKDTREIVGAARVIGEAAVRQLRVVSS